MNKQNSLFLPVLLTLLGVVTIGSGSWDNGWHMMKQPEWTLSPPHVLQYLAVALAAVLSFRLLITGVKQHGAPYKVPHIRAIALTVVGIGLQVLALGTDAVVHVVNEFDITLWTPPHVIVAFGGLVYMLGVADLFLGYADSKQAKAGFLVALGISIAFMQSALGEYDMRTYWGWQARWQGFTLYYATLLYPVIAYAAILGTRRLGIPCGTLVTLTPFAIKLMIFGVWSFYPVSLYFPALIIIGGFLFDCLYMTYRDKGTLATDAGVAGLALGIVAAVVFQHPLSATWSDLAFGLISCFLTGLFTAWIVDSLYGKEEDLEHAETTIAV